MELSLDVEERHTHLSRGVPPIQDSQMKEAAVRICGANLSGDFIASKALRTLQLALMLRVLSFSYVLKEDADQNLVIIELASTR